MALLSVIPMGSCGGENARIGACEPFVYDHVFYAVGCGLFCCICVALRSGVPMCSCGGASARIESCEPFV